LAIDPSVVWNKNKLSSILTQTIYRETCLYKSKDDCYDNLLKFLKVLKIDNFSSKEKKVKSLIKEKINAQIARTKVTSVILKTELTEDENFEVERMNLAWVSVFNNSIYVNPEQINDVNFVISKIWNIVEIENERLKKLLSKRALKYVKIYNRLSLSASEYLNWEIEKEKNDIKNGVIDKKDAFSTFVILEPKQTRFYPESGLASQVVWFLDSSKVGRYWIEWYYDELLKWKKWIKIYKSWTAGWEIDPTATKEEEKAVNWADIVLTIDRNIQNFVERELEDKVKFFKANKGSVTIMNPKTGEILAMANYPSYNPNKFWDVYEIEKVSPLKYSDPTFDLAWLPLLIEDKAEWEKYFYKWELLYLRKATDEEIKLGTKTLYKFKNNIWPESYRNNAIEYVYEPWSIFKPIVMAIWLDSWDVHRFDSYLDKGYAEIDNFKIKNVAKQCNGYNTYQNAINWSCNAWMIDIIQKIGKSLMYKYLWDFGFLEKTWIPLLWEQNYKISPYEQWSRADLFTMSYGRWLVLTNQLQMAQAYSILANGWIYYEPHIIKEFRYDNGRVVKNEPNPLRRVIKEDTSKEITKMLQEWMLRDKKGEAIWASVKWYVEWYNLAWKTWTSGYVKKWKYEVMEWRVDSLWASIAHFAWYWPVQNPKFVIIVRLDRPKYNRYYKDASAQYWGQTSAVIFKNIASYLLDYYKIPKSNTNNKTEK
jgi:stage V sporulation protein D (sporulation-specific penicillin-binding protein)